MAIAMWSIVILSLVHLSQGQRLSQGASDWYMRFHDFDMVKRDFDRLTTKSFHVNSIVRHRFATTEVISVIHNPSQIKQVFKFGFAMPRAAFVSNVTLMRGDEQVLAQVSESDWSKTPKEKKAPGGGTQSNGHHASHLSKERMDALTIDNAYFKQFVLPIHLEPKDDVTLSLVYEYLLSRDDFHYTHTLSISPGEIVKDFKISLKIEENNKFSKVNISAPVIGEITADANVSDSQLEIDFRMSDVEQFHYFGSHGFTGDFKTHFDVEIPENSVDLTVQDNYFLHFYDISQNMSSIPKHVMFMIDNSMSMSGPKMDHARDAIKLLMKTALSDRDFFNIITFNDNIDIWDPSVENVNGDEGHSNTLKDVSNVVERAFSATQNLTSQASQYLESLSPNGKSNITAVIRKALDLDESIWNSNGLPDNTYTLMILITDGRAHLNRSEAKVVRRTIRKWNKITRIPIVALGMGFDANMAILENIAEKSGAKALHVIEDLEVQPQLSNIQRHMNDVVLKDLRLQYIGQAFAQASITKKKFKAFHQGRSVVVAGKWNTHEEMPTHPEFEVEVTGQSSNGLFMEDSASVPFTYNTQGCRGNVTLCSEFNLGGHCIVVDMSRANLKKYSFSKQATSLEIDGDCAWVAYSEAYYQGRNVTFMPGRYDVVPDLHKEISSLKRVPVTKFDEPTPEDTEEPTHYHDEHTHEPIINRVWAYLTIKDILEKMEIRPDTMTQDDVTRATKLAMEYNFLTPFTDIYLTEESPNPNLVEPSNMMVENNFLTFRDLTPVFLAMDDPDIARQWEALKSCEDPIRCEGNFHVEEFPDVTDSDSLELDEQNCTGFISLFTKTDFEGESFEATMSIHQLYHSVNSQRMRSIRVHGDCCWLLFDQRFFSGNVEKVCGDFEQPLRMTNIGSVKRIVPPT